MLRIRDWKSVFENARSREIKRLEWVSIPNRHDGGKYAELMEHERGAEHFAAWILMVQVASRCGDLAERRGDLRRGDGTPHNARSLFLATRCPERIFKEAIPRLISIGWLESDEISPISQDAATIPQQATTIPQLVPTLGEGIGGDGMGSEGTGKEQPAAHRVKAKAKKGETPIPPPVLSVYEFYHRMFKASARKADALKWIERRGNEHGYERLIMAINLYRVDATEKKTEPKFYKDCANFFGEDAAFEAHLPDEEFYAKYLAKAQSELTGGVNGQTAAA